MRRNQNRRKHNDGKQSTFFSLEERQEKLYSISRSLGYLDLVIPWERFRPFAVNGVQGQFRQRRAARFVLRPEIVFFLLFRERLPIKRTRAGTSDTNSNKKFHTPLVNQ